ncbi:MAG: hypothetical protein ACR2KK_00690 [Acidimicrobiales bacterium]
MAKSEHEFPEARTEQVNIRLTRAEYDVVQALIFLDEGRSSATDVLRSVVNEFLDQQRDDEDVQLALGALGKRRARKAGKLKSLRDSRNETA